MRKYNVDIIKCYAMFLVIFIHFDNPVVADVGLPYYFLRIIATTGVPLFLICSGYIIIEKEYSYREILKKVISLLILATLYKFITLLAMQGELSFRSIADLIFDSTYKGVKFGYDTGPFWYIYAYIAILLLQPLLAIVYKYKSVFKWFSIIVIIYVFALLYISELFTYFTSGIKGTVFKDTFPFKYTNYSAIGFFIVGCLFRMYDDKIKHYINGNQKGLIIFKFGTLFIVSVIMGTLFTNYLNTTDSLDLNLSYVTYNYRTIFGFIMSCSTFIIMNYVMPSFSNKFIFFAARNTLGIYFLHLPIGFIIKQFGFKYEMMINPFGNFLLTVMIYLFCCSLIYILRLNKYTCKLVQI